MTPEQVLSCKPVRLTQRQREFYFENGYLLLEGIPLDIIERLRGVTAEKVEETRNLTNPMLSGISRLVTAPLGRNSAAFPALAITTRPTGTTRPVHFSWTSLRTSLGRMSSSTTRN
jgi:hypothetical protein